MSRHHRAQKWTTHAPKLRATITPQLPLPCIDCGHPVTPDQKWQVGHRLAAGLGGRPTRANTGPSHTYCPACNRKCNQSAGGKLGAAVVNAKRKSESERTQAEAGRRSWR